MVHISWLPPRWAATMVGAVGVLAAVLLPIAPVSADRTDVTWPSPGAPAVSTSAIFVPYRPTELRATLPCSALRAHWTRSRSATVLATASDERGLLVLRQPGGARLLQNGRVDDLRLPPDEADCRLDVDAGPAGVRITEPDGHVVVHSGDPVPRVFGFRTDLPPDQARGLGVTAIADSVFATSPSPVKTALILVQLLAVAAALTLLTRRARWLRWWSATRLRRLALQWRRSWWVDLAVVAVLGAWAIAGPLAVDDGWATAIARNVVATGNAGNYYRWWNASEVPFAFSEHLLAPWTQVSLAPLWLRLPSTALGLATWFVLSRGVLAKALPRGGTAPAVRWCAAAFFLLAWLPFNLGARPESQVAFGTTVVLALLWRARDPAGIGWATLAAALTLPISPTSVIVAGPVVVFAPRVVRILRRGTRRDAITDAVLLCCVGAVALTVIFADDTWAALLTATDWHTFFGPSLPWYREPDRYAYLLGGAQDGSAAKRAPVLLAAAMVVVVAALPLARAARDAVDRASLTLALVVAVAFASIAVVPSKWSYHLGAMGGFFAAFLTVAVVSIMRRAAVREPGPNRRAVAVGALGAVMIAGAAALSFDGPNAWWLPILYDMPGSGGGSTRPFGLPTNAIAFWLGVLLVCIAGAAALRRTTIARMFVAGPALLAGLSTVVMVTTLLVTFLSAPVRQPSGSLALANLHRLSGGPRCGLADDVQVMPDGAPLAMVDGAGQRTDGFMFLTGFLPTAPPPDPPGSGASVALWGSWASAQHTGVLISPWFTLPPLHHGQGVAVSVSGRTDGGNALALEFGASQTDAVKTLGERSPLDRVAVDEDPTHPLWRTIGIDAADVPADADRVRLRATDDRTDPSGWLAVTGPRLRSVVGLNEFLAGRGPVLVAWPMAFLFPCVPNTPIVADGLAQTPNAVIEGPRPRLDQERDPYLGGTFAEVDQFGKLGEVPTRLRGRPDVEWGALYVSHDTARRDAYRSVVTGVSRSGLDGTGRSRPEHQ